MHTSEGDSRLLLKQPDPRGGMSVCLQYNVELSEGSVLLR